MEKLWESYTMLTINANLHSIKSRMHRPEIDRTKKKPLEVQDKGSVVAIEAHDFDRWLTCTPEEAREMVQLIPVELIDAGLAADLQPREDAAVAVSSIETEDLPF